MTAPPTNPILRELGAYPLAAFQDLKLEMAEQGRLRHDFSVGDPIEPTPPLIRDAFAAGIDEAHRHPDPDGSPALRGAIAGWVRRRFGVEVDPDAHVLATAGSKEGIFHLPLGLDDGGGAKRTALWGAPGYPAYDRGQRFAGGESDPVDLTEDLGWRLELGELAPQRLDRALVAWTCYPHNPTGAAVDLAYHRRALEVAHAHGIVLGSDECYVDIHPEDATPPPSLLQAADGDLRGVVVAFSLSKRSGMTGYRSGALVGDPAIIDAQRALRRAAGLASPPFVQHAAAAAWADDAHVAERRRTFDAKRRVILAFLAEAGIRVSGSEMTFYVWAAAPGGDDVAYARALVEQGIVITPGSAFGPAGAGWFRLALVPSVEDCRRAAREWGAAAAAGLLPGS